MVQTKNKKMKFEENKEKYRGMLGHGRVNAFKSVQ